MEATIARVLQVFAALAGAYILALWFALAVWTYRDITSRTTNAVVQVFSTLLVVLFFAPGAVIYLILRPRETLDETFQRSIEEEYLVQDLEEFPLCPSCRRAVRDDFVYCPYCHVELRRACSLCRRVIDLRWEICPYCGVEQFAAPLAVTADAGDESRSRDKEPVSALESTRLTIRPTLERPEKRQHWEHDDDPPLVTPVPAADAIKPNGDHDDPDDALLPETGGVTPPVDELTRRNARGRGSARRQAGSGS